MEDKEFSSINVIPLVDIMLVLLTIVLITATFVVQGSIPVNLPKASKKHEEALKSLEIVLTKEGRVFFEGREVSLKELEKILESLEPTTRIIIAGDREANLQSLVSLLDILKRKGFERVSIRTEVGA
ncbi:MAG: biopolymer transporter ExbD [Aquificaceae bacterium]|nr:biopolymer transporter ExbD [Aquificaceae bacterium]MCS7195922.1 biopolymer transporter ExbD [Aquificaceae bacterium]MCX7989101.1 biopolymer transporter ExbD [Aquificaceae bacterium]MDW8033262.1 biopolymer transporter ExbD [Aquificaceae bacterium]MDW8293932.1 biopolymer transporter ExbD [Aquificaceae bacterium]